LPWDPCRVKSSSVKVPQKCMTPLNIVLSLFSLKQICNKWGKYHCLYHGIILTLTWSSWEKPCETCQDSNCIPPIHKSRALTLCYLTFCTGNMSHDITRLPTNVCYDGKLPFCATNMHSAIEILEVFQI
jgi:hypothetical protein